MASFEKTIAIIFNGEDRVTRVAGDVASAVGKVGDVVESASGPLANLAGGVLKLDAALAAMVVGGLALAERESSKFKDSFNEITTLFEDAPANVGRFKEQIKEYARDSTQSIEDVNAAVYSAISSGVEYKDSLELIGVAEKLAVGGKSSLAESTDLLVASLNAYGESADKAGRYSDIFFKTVQLGQTTIPELAQGLGNVTPIAATAGVSIEQVSASIAALTIVMAAARPRRRRISAPRSRTSSSRARRPSRRPPPLASSLTWPPSRARASPSFCRTCTRRPRATRPSWPSSLAT